ncbi:magnesium transporter CorA family protein [Candidatus Saccharibacteria bacterium]|nr:magnesium transporter CorA family protein [Candidatus Saccharibacteria bacterium]
MLKCFKTNTKEQRLEEISEIVPDCWIDLSEPSEAEIQHVVDTTHVEPGLIRKMLDSDELPRIESEKGANLVVIDAPVFDNQEREYITYPLGIIIMENNYVITVAPKSIPLLNQFRQGEAKDFRTSKKSRFLIQVLNATAAAYLKALNEIYRDIDHKEEVLKKSTKNEDLIDLLGTEKTLVYFIASLTENSKVLERLNNGSTVQLYEGDDRLIKDAIIEYSQAIDMATLYRKILSSITDTYANVISNNLDYTMRFLAGVTIALSIPTIISSFLGMNVWFGEVGTNHAAWWIIGLVSVLLTIAVAALLKKKGML